MDSIETDINSYTFNELKNIFNLNNDFYTKKELESEYEKKLDSNNQIEDENLKENLNLFFKNIYEFLLLNSKDKVISTQGNFLQDNEVKNDDDIKKINSKLDYLVNFNYQSNPKILGDVVSTDQVNQSNIPLNPRTYNTIKKQISINSEFRKKYANANFNIFQPNDSTLFTKETQSLDSTSTDFTIELPDILENVISMELVNIEIPNIINTFSEVKENNKFKICVYYGGTKEEHEITIPSGVWVSADLVDFLSNNFLNIDISNGTTFENEYLRYLEFEINSWSGKPVFRFKTENEIEEYNLKEQSDGSSTTSPLYITTAETLSFSIENIEVDKNCKNSRYKYNNKYNYNSLKTENFGLTLLGTMGYDLHQIYENEVPIKIAYTDSKYKKIYNTNLIYNGYLETQKLYGSTGETAVYISVNEFVGNHGQQILLLGYNNTLIADNVLARVPLTTSPFGQNTSNSLVDYKIVRNYYGGVRIRKLHIQILDKYGRIIDLQDYPTNFVFEFTIQYSSERLSVFRNKM